MGILLTVAGGRETQFCQEHLAWARWQNSILAGNFGGQAGYQPAIQPIANRRYLAGAGGFLKNDNFET